jgi:hypothetical protein
MAGETPAATMRRAGEMPRPNHRLVTADELDTTASRFPAVRRAYYQRGVSL